MCGSTHSNPCSIHAISFAFTDAHTAHRNATDAGELRKGGKTKYPGGSRSTNMRSDRQTGFESRLPRLLAARSGANVLSSLSLSFSTCERPLGRPSPVPSRRQHSACAE